MSQPYDTRLNKVFIKTALDLAVPPAEHYVAVAAPNHGSKRLTKRSQKKKGRAAPTHTPAPPGRGGCARPPLSPPAAGAPLRSFGAPHHPTPPVQDMPGAEFQMGPCSPTRVSGTWGWVTRCAQPGSPPPEH